MNGQLGGIVPLDELDIRTLPTPIANAIVAFEAASNPHEQRDRLVEVFRATLRYLGGLALAVRLGHGPGPKGDSEDAQRLLDRLKRQSLTDGEWVGLTRELLRAWRSAPETHPLPTLVQVVVGRRTKIHTGLDELLSMRKRETVAHGTTGTEQEARAIVTERLPQLVDLLNTLAPLFEEARVVVPLSQPNEPDVRQRAWLFHGPTTLHGEWRSLELAGGVRAVPKRPVMIDSQGNVRLELEPSVLCERASPEVPEDLFFFDGRRKRSAAFVAFPSIAEVWREDVLERLGIAMSIADDAVTATEPFLGLRSFGPKDAALFVGRERLVEELTNRVTSNSWVTLVGASGSGKTSLLAAGVGPALRERVEREGYREADDVYAIVMFRPGTAPQRALARELDECVGLVLDPEAPETWPKRILDWCTLRRRVLVLMVDQAEELITQCKDHELREAFGRLLSELTTSTNLPVRVVFSLRVDFMARLATIRSLGDRYHRATQVVTTPSQADLVRILTEPALRFGVRWENGLAEDIASRIADEESALALISYVGSRVWRARGDSEVLLRSAYEQVGGVEGSLATHADAVVARWTDSQKRVARAMLLRLATVEWTRDAVPRAELEEVGGSEALTILRTLETERLVITRMSDNALPPTAVVELAHESLLRHWPQIQEWRDEDRESTTHHARLVAATREWNANGRSDDLLWSERLLVAHRRIAQRRHLQLSDHEISFIAASEFAIVEQARARDEQRREIERAHEQATLESRRASAREMVARAISLSDETAGTVLMRVAADLDDSARDLAETHGNLRRRESGPISRVLARGVSSAAYSPNGSHIATGFQNGNAMVWDARTGSARMRLCGHDGSLLSISFSNDGVTILTSSEDFTARLWDACSGSEHIVLRGHRGSVLGASFSPDGGRVLSWSSDSTAWIWSVSSGEPVMVLAGHDGAVVSACWLDSERVITGSADGNTRVWECVHNPRLVTRQFHVASVTSVVSSLADPRVFLAGTADGATRIYSIDAPKPQELYGHESRVSSVAISTDGHRFASASFDRTARIWNTHFQTKVTTSLARGVSVESNAKVQRKQVLTHSSPVLAVSFSPDGENVITGSESGWAHIWSANTGEEIARLGRHEAPVTLALFSPTGDTAFTVGDTGRLWGLKDEHASISARTNVRVDATYQEVAPVSVPVDSRCRAMFESTLLVSEDACPIADGSRVDVQTSAHIVASDIPDDIDVNRARAKLVGAKEHLRDLEVLFGMTLGVLLGAGLPLYLIYIVAWGNTSFQRNLGWILCSFIALSCFSYFLVYKISVAIWRWIFRY